jgi:hypothetical protein
MYQKNRKSIIDGKQQTKYSIRMADALEVSLDYLVGKTDMVIDSSNP